MKRVRVVALCGLSLLLALATPAWAGHELKLGSDGQGQLGQNIDVPLTLASDGNVQGFVATFDWSGALLEGQNLVTSAALASADVVVPRIEAAFAVLGVVMDSDGTGGEIIPANPAGTQLAMLTVKALGPAGPDPVVVPLEFKDNLYATVDLGPALSNIIVIGGQSIGVDEGLVLTDGSVRLIPPPPGTFKVKSASGFFGADVGVPMELASASDVQGFVMAVRNGAGATLVNVAPIGPAAGNDFFKDELFADGGTLAVVMELDGVAPFRVIPAGTANVATFTYSSPAITSAAECDLVKEIPLTFVDFVYGDPLLENVIVIAGRSKNPELIPGTLTLRANPNEPPCKVVVPSEMTFAVGTCELTADGVPGKILGHPGEKVQVGLWYKSPDDELSDEATQTDHIQGISMALCYDPAFILCKETYSLAGTITETVGAEFVNVHCENDLNDGDPASLVVGILVDALPPFDGQTLPSTEEFLKLICIDFEISPTAPCDQCSPIYFCEANGRGKVPIRNLASVRNHSVVPKLFNNEVCTLATPVFIRGDCNFAELDSIMFHPGTSPNGRYEVDIADAASVISFLFLTGVDKFDPPCLDACDANDDGRIDLADSVFILQYLFKVGAKEPKPPFPDPGADPTPDRLGCTAGSICL